MPATAQAPPQQRQPPARQQKPSDAQLIALLVAAFVTYHTAAQILAALRLPFRAAGISVKALQAAIGLVLSMPLPGMEGTGPAARWAARTNELRRASFTLATARRIEQAVKEAQAHGEPVIPAIQKALQDEARWFKQHQEASAGRIDAASRVDGAAAQYGPLLGWQATLDQRCTPGCRSSSGKNFRADHPPMVEGHPSYPGAVHGATCRCVPVAPFKGAPVMS